MPVIAIVNQKGGTGETTLATNLAAAFSATERVLLLDADPQGSSRDWAENHPRLCLTVKETDGRHLVEEVRQQSSDYHWVIIDGPPGTSKTNADAVRAADLVLIPA